MQYPSDQCFYFLIVDPADNGNLGRHGSQLVQWFEHQRLDGLGILCRIHRYCTCVDLHSKEAISSFILWHAKFYSRRSILQFLLVGMLRSLSVTTTSFSSPH